MASPRMLVLRPNHRRTAVVLLCACVLIYILNLSNILPWLSCAIWRQLGAAHKCLDPDVRLSGLSNGSAPGHVVLSRMPNFEDLPPRVVRNNTGLKTILFWTAYWGSPTWDYETLGTVPFEHEFCRFRCYATNSKASLSKADAVVFHFDDIDGMSWPSQLTEDTVSVLAVFEPPNIVRKKMRNFDNKIHFVMSHRRDSNIHAPYGVFRPTDMKNATSYTPRIPLKDRPKSVVWVSSNCAAASHRELYVKELAKYIDVDIYGKCGTLSCAKEEWGNCFSMFESTYKFYLSFENSICKDYVTEKLFEPLKREIVPVVFGGTDYKLDYPPGSGSVINIMDYSSPKALAEYLKQLSQNETAYNKYLETKNLYRIPSTHGPLSMGLCSLCDWLSSRDIHRSWPYRKDITSWWYNEQCNNDFILKQKKHW